MMERGKLFRAFCVAYLSEHIKKEFSSVHMEWFGYVDEVKLGIVAPRGLGKSSFWSFFYPLFCLLVEGKQIAIVSSGMRLAEKFMGMIVRELEENQRIRRDYGDVKGDKWTADWIRLKGGGELQCLGSDGRIRGMRPDVLIVDDIENDENVRSEDYRKKLKQRFLKSWYFTLKPRGQVVVVGTLLHPMSLLADIVSGDDGSGFKSYFTRKYAMLVNGKGEPDLNGKSIWEAQWPTDLLYQERDDCLEAFEQERQNNPIPDEMRKFAEADILYYNKVPIGAPCVMTIDPAVDIDKDKDYTAFIVLASGEDGVMFVVEAYRKRLEPGEVIDKLFQFNDIYKPHTIGIEDVAVSKLYRKYFELEAKRRGVYPNIQPMKLAMSRSGRSKQYRIEALRPFFKQGKIKIHKDHIDLKGELLSFPTGKHDDLCFVGDTLIATKFGNKKIKDIKIGDYVLTPLGYSKVTACGCTGKKEVIEKLGLRATPNHPVFTKDGFVSIDALTLSSKTSKLSFKEVMLWRYKSLLSLMEFNIDLWGRESIIYLNQKQIKAESLLKDFMWRFGSFITKKQFLKVLLFITKTAILLTTIFLTWSVFHIANTIKLGKLPKRYWIISKRYVRLLQGGISLRKEKYHIVYKQRNNGKIIQRIVLFARTVSQFLFHRLKTLYFVPLYVGTDIELRADFIKKKEFAMNVEKNLKLNLNTIKEGFVHQSAELNLEEKQDVYNITTTAGVYYANDILVSNCDALALCLELEKPMKVFKPTFVPGSFDEYLHNLKRKKKDTRFHQWVHQRHQRLQSI